MFFYEFIKFLYYLRSAAKKEGYSFEPDDYAMLAFKQFIFLGDITLAMAYQRRISIFDEYRIQNRVRLEEPLLPFFDVLKMPSFNWVKPQTLTTLQTVSDTVYVVGNNQLWFVNKTKNTRELLGVEPAQFSAFCNYLHTADLKIDQSRTLSYEEQRAVANIIGPDIFSPPVPLTAVSMDEICGQVIPACFYELCKLSTKFFKDFIERSFAKINTFYTEEYLVEAVSLIAEAKKWNSKFSLPDLNRFTLFTPIDFITLESILERQNFFDCSGSRATWLIQFFTYLGGLANVTNDLPYHTRIINLPAIAGLSRYLFAIGNPEEHLERLCSFTDMFKEFADLHSAYIAKEANKVENKKFIAVLADNFRSKLESLFASSCKKDSFGAKPHFTNSILFLINLIDRFKININIEEIKHESSGFEESFKLFEQRLKEMFSTRGGSIFQSWDRFSGSSARVFGRRSS